MYKQIQTSRSYPKESGSYFAHTERGEMIVLEWTGEVTKGWQRVDFWLWQMCDGCTDCDFSKECFPKCLD